VKLVSYVKDITAIEFVRKQGTEESIGPEKCEVTRGWEKLHNEEIYKFYSSPNIIGMMKSGRMRLAVHVMRMGR
jgi:hypothetical protein